MGNPRRRKSHRRHHRRSHRRARGLFSNPSFGGSISAVTAPVKEMVRKDFLVEAVSVAAGVMLPAVVTTRFIPAAWRNTTFKGYAVKAGVVAGISAFASIAFGKKVSRAVLLGGGVSLALDIYTDFVGPMVGNAVGSMLPAPTGALPAPAPGAATYFGDRNLAAWYGGHDGLSDASGASIGSAFGGMGDQAYA